MHVALRRDDTHGGAARTREGADAADRIVFSAAQAIGALAVSRATKRTRAWIRLDHMPPPISVSHVTVAADVRSLDKRGERREYPAKDGVVPVVREQIEWSAAL